MIAAWMLYCALWALWLSAVAWMTERVLLNTRGQVRTVWLSAMVLSVVGPIFGYALSRREPVVPAAATAVSSSTANAPIMVRRYARTRGVDISQSVRIAAARVDRPLAVAWIASMLGVLLYIGGGVVRLRIVRRRWHPDVVVGTPVMISDDTGPALVGVFDTTIVIPAWALELEPDSLALMLRHELEHRAAGDTRTLAIAQALVVLMPWNPLMWWQLRRLRLAIELDCDARVLRCTSDVAAYGKLLLEFGRMPRDRRVAGTALADHHASQLEARIRRLIRHAPARRGRAISLSIAAMATAIAIGCQLPTPPSPAPNDASRSTRPARDSVAIAKDTAVTSRHALVRALDTMDVRDRELIASMNRELERMRAEERRTLREAEVRGEARTPTSLRDPLVKQFFDAQVRVNQTSDSAERQWWVAQRDTLRWALDSIPKMWPSPQAPTLYAERVTDSLKLELARLRMTMTDQHPQVRAVLTKLQSIALVFPDSIAALEPSPGCTSAAGESLVKLIVPNEAALRPGAIVVQSEVTRSRNVLVEFDAGMMCSGPGELRLYGHGAFDGRSIVVRSAIPSSIVVVTGSGRVLVGPIPLENAVHRYELRWSAR